MVPRSICSFALASFAFAVSADATAQQTTPSATEPAPQAPSGQPAQGGGSGNGGNGPATEDDKKAPTGSVGGYAYSDKPMRSTSSGAPHTHYRKNGPVVNLPGFEQTADGGSRLFVQLTQTVPVEERKAQGSVTYVLKGASPRVWNNTNALVTVHFNTPVARARLVPQGGDLLFIIELRALATPAWKMIEGPDKSQMLAIDFPKGDYLNAPEQPIASGTPENPKPVKRAAAKRSVPPPKKKP